MGRNKLSIKNKISEKQSIAPKVLYPKGKIYPPYVSKHNSNHEKQVIFLMVSNGE